MDPEFDALIREALTDPAKCVDAMRFCAATAAFIRQQLLLAELEGRQAALVQAPLNERPKWLDPSPTTVGADAARLHRAWSAGYASVAHRG